MNVLFLILSYFEPKILEVLKLTTYLFKAGNNLIKHFFFFFFYIFMYKYICVLSMAKRIQNRFPLSYDF